MDSKIPVLRVAAVGAIAGPLVGLLTLREPLAGGSAAAFLAWSVATGFLMPAIYTGLARLPQLLAPQLQGRALQQWVAVAAGAGMIIALIVPLRGLPLVGIRLAHPVDSLLFGGMVGLTSALFLFWSERRDLRRRSAERASQAAALASRLQPHFFFNTLNTVSALIPDQPKEAQRTLERLAGLMRGTLGASGFVPLSDELALVRDYLEIEKARFGDRLRYSLPDAPPEVKLPSLTLQPLVENAVRHGVAKRMDGGQVSVTCTQSDAAFTLEVTSPYDDPPTSFSREGGSLEVVRERLQLLYSGRATLETSVGENVCVRLRLPRKWKSCES